MTYMKLCPKCTNYLCSHGLHNLMKGGECICYHINHTYYLLALIKFPCVQPQEENKVVEFSIPSFGTYSKSIYNSSLHMHHFSFEPNLEWS
jgi:hypothetical protein